MIDPYRLAKEYAGEEFSISQPEFWLCVSAFLKGYETAGKDDEPYEKMVKAIRFYFHCRRVEVPLAHPFKVANEKKFILELKKIVNAKAVNLL